jgi:hypothetical protein
MPFSQLGVLGPLVAAVGVALICIGPVSTTAVRTFVPGLLLLAISCVIAAPVAEARFDLLDPAKNAPFNLVPWSFLIPKVESFLSGPSTATIGYWSVGGEWSLSAASRGAIVGFLLVGALGAASGTAANKPGSAKASVLGQVSPAILGCYLLATIVALLAKDLAALVISFPLVAWMTWLLIVQATPSEGRSSAQTYVLQQMIGLGLVLAGLILLSAAYPAMNADFSIEPQSPLTSISLLAQRTAWLTWRNEVALAYWMEVRGLIFVTLIAGVWILLQLFPFHTAGLKLIDQVTLPVWALVTTGRLAIGYVALAEWGVPILVRELSESAGLICGVASWVSLYFACLALAQHQLRRLAACLVLFASAWGVTCLTTLSEPGSVAARLVFLSLAGGIAITITAIMRLEQAYGLVELDGFRGFWSLNRPIVLTLGFGLATLALIPGTASIPGIGFGGLAIWRALGLSGAGGLCGLVVCWWAVGRVLERFATGAPREPIGFWQHREAKTTQFTEGWIGPFRFNFTVQSPSTAQIASTTDVGEGQRLVTSEEVNWPRQAVLLGAFALAVSTSLLPFVWWRG